MERELFAPLTFLEATGLRIQTKRVPTIPVSPYTAIKSSSREFCFLQQDYSRRRGGAWSQQKGDDGRRRLNLPTEQQGQSIRGQMPPQPLISSTVQDKSLSSGIFFLDLLSSVAPRVVDWNLVKRGGTEDDRKMNASYIISVARKLGCSIFLLPEDILEVNQKMMLTLAASIMYWSSKQSPEEATGSSDTDGGNLSESNSALATDDSASETSIEES